MNGQEISNRLSRHGHQVDQVDTGRAALETYEDADMVLLDLELPDLDGLEVCRLIRAKSDKPLITLTTSQTHLDRVLSLQAGADDSMTKPFEFRELMARINAVMRRLLPRPSSSPIVRHGPLTIDPRSRRVQLDECLISLTRKEFDLLYLLASSAETVVSRRELMSRIWADDWATESRTVDTHISTLRNKLGHADWIVTIRGVGYRLGTGTVCTKAALASAPYPRETD